MLPDLAPPLRLCGAHLQAASVRQSVCLQQHPRRLRRTRQSACLRQHPRRLRRTRGEKLRPRGSCALSLDFLRLIPAILPQVNSDTRLNEIQSLINNSPQRGDTGKRRNRRKHGDNRYLFPAAHLKMMMNGSHLENPLAVGQLEISHLKHDRQSLYQIYYAADQYKNTAYRRTLQELRQVRLKTASPCRP